MADIDITRVHNLGLAAAREAAERMEAQLGRKFDLKGAWTGNVLSFERPGVSGSLKITDKDLHLSVALGFLLKAMKGSIEKAVVHELDTLFAAKPATPPAKGPPGQAASPKAGGEKPISKKAPAPRKKGG
jgi:putative polyhydroxyalkanoate system protein